MYLTSKAGLVGYVAPNNFNLIGITIMATINNTSTTTSTKRKAAAFINVAVSNKDRTKTKQVGGLPLYADNEFHAQLLAHLKTGGSVKLSTDVHVVETTESFEFE